MEVTTSDIVTASSYEPTTGSSSTSDRLDFWGHLLTVLMAVIGVSALIGNLLVLIAFATDKKVRRLNFNLFLFNLAITDVLVSVVAVPFYVIDIALGYWPFDEYVCALWIFMDWGMTFASIFNLVAISIDRFWAVQFSTHYKQKSTRRNNILTICLIW